jgi:hypothetical protein
MHPRKTPASLKSQRCVSCLGAGSLRNAKLILDWEWKRDHVPGAPSDPRNRAVLCRLCEEAYRLFLGQAAATPDIAAIMEHRRSALESLALRRSELFCRLPKEDLFGSFGRVETKKEFQAKLEKGRL